MFGAVIFGAPRRRRHLYLVCVARVSRPAREVTGGAPRGTE